MTSVCGGGGLCVVLLLLLQSFLFFVPLEAAVVGPSEGSSRVPNARAAVTVSVEQTDLISTPSVSGLSIDNVAHSIYGGGLFSQLVFGESFEESAATAGVAREQEANASIWWKGDGGSVAPWLPFGDIVSSTALEPLHGRRSAILTCNGAAVCPWCVAMGNKGLNGTGISVLANHSYEGFAYFRTTAPANVSVGIFLGLKELAFHEFYIPYPSDWQRYNFTLVPTLSTVGATFIVSMVPDSTAYRTARAQGTCVVAGDESNGATVGVDMVFLQPGSWNRFQQGNVPARADVAQQLPQHGTLRFGGHMVRAHDYAWHSMRGPMEGRPPRYGDVYYAYESNGFGMFEFLQIVEMMGGQASMPIVGVSATAETASSVAGLAEYLWGDASSGSPYAAQRVSDGHRTPYPPIMLEVGWQQELNDTYVRQFSALVTAVVDVLQVHEPVLLSRVKFVIAAAPVFNLSGPTVKHLLSFCQSLPASSMCVWGLSVKVDSLDALNAWSAATFTPLAQQAKEAGVRIIFSEVDYAGATPSPFLGRSLHRAAINALVSSFALTNNVSTVLPATWAARYCDNDGTVCDDPYSAHTPSGQLDITPNVLVPQPPAYAGTLVRGFMAGSVARVSGPGAAIQNADRTVSLLSGARPISASPHPSHSSSRSSSSPSSSSSSSSSSSFSASSTLPITATTTTPVDWVDVTAVYQLASSTCVKACSCNLSLAIIHQGDTTLDFDVTLTGASADLGLSQASVYQLACDSPSAINSLTNTTACATVLLPPLSFSEKTALHVTVQPHSFTVVSASRMTCLL